MVNIQTKTAFSGSFPLSGITDFCISSLWWNKDLKQVSFWAEMHGESDDYEDNEMGWECKSLELLIICAV